MAHRGEFNLPDLFELIMEWQGFALTYQDECMDELLSPIYEALKNALN